VQYFDCSRNARTACRAETISVSAPGHYRARAQAQRFYNIAAATNAAIQQHLDTILYACDNFRQNAERRCDTIELPPTVIRNDQRVCSYVHRATGIVYGVNPFYHNGPVPRLTDPVKVLPDHH
jgi:hypothetical protein